MDTTYKGAERRCEVCWTFRLDVEWRKDHLLGRAFLACGGCMNYMADCARLLLDQLAKAS